MKTRAAGLLLLPVLLVGCSGGDSTGTAVTPDVAASAPVPGLTLPPDALAALVPQPDEVPAGMVPLLTGTGPKTVAEVAAYSGASAAAAEAKLKAHGFTSAYVAQYANEATAQGVTVLASAFATEAGATADFADDLAAANGAKTVASPVLGDQSSVTIQDLPGGKGGQLVLVRFRRGVNTWSLAYQAVPTAEPSVATDLATRILTRTLG